MGFGGEGHAGVASEGGSLLLGHHSEMLARNEAGGDQLASGDHGVLGRGEHRCEGAGVERVAHIDQDVLVEAEDAHAQLRDVGRGRNRYDLLASGV